ncbi:Uncharacterised protein [Streptococcus pneumoniae]|nr:Uncharacterised protein [Streptococcus pneumoniae]CXF60385.1 Uncharacterised protein [Streptococcus pneumoniae]
MRFFLIELSYIGQKILIWIIEVGEEIDIALDKLTLTDKENLHTHPALIHIVAKDIAILQIFRHDPLLGSKRSNSLNQVTVFRRTFKLHTLCCYCHFTLEIIDDFVILTFQKIRHLLSHRLEISLILLTDGVGHTLADMVIKTDLRGRVGTFSKRENPI